MSKFITFTLVSCVLILVSCSSSTNGFREVSWGSSLDLVKKKEKERGNKDFEEKIDKISDENIIELWYDKIIISGQKTESLEYEFKKEFNGKIYDEPVLVEGTYYFDHNNFDEEVLLKDLKSKYGKGQKKINYMDDPYYEWISGKTQIQYWPDPYDPFLSYNHISEDSHPEKDSNENGEDTGL
ncbi:hypothetical protein QNH39_26400 [Neobacillus novalis]|uniref:Lipoprotein n=1 Tax=Neobacillus novalis TaxID=220687 RepID=A0AA95MLA1_9BACI|nr:hypothetical protein [Neobacillus novalis]WHY86062.1 hypothetical protein QNH39_26400 [Neobacillus novalis]